MFTGKNFYSLAVALLYVAGMTACNSQASHHDHDHEHVHESHDGHDHDHEGHDHDHEGHDHDHDHEGHDHDHEGHDHDHEGHDEHGGDEIVLKPEAAQKLGVEVAEIVPAPFVETLKVTGEILPSSADRSVAAARNSGIVKLAPGINAGAQVRAGQTIATVSARGVAGGDTNASTLAALESAKRELDRVTPLLADGLVTRKDYNDALAAYEAAKAAHSPAAASGSVTAPGSGVITAVNVGNGEFVDAGQPIVSIAANTRLTLRAMVPVSQASFLPSVSGAMLASHSGGAVDLDDHGCKLLSSAPASAGSTPGYVPVYFTFDSSAPVIPGSATEVYLKGPSRSSVLSVPLDAVVEQMGEKFVFVKVDEHGYEKRNVTLGNTDGRSVAILSGITPGETVVVKGATFVRLAEQATVAPEGHSHNH
ncbi:MAG: efflux RND transporter periplasmic adaptor subunit [Duncaniella sp.]|nr:efflux RND transporter periplasmic adaptor subunit [Duncaniella sp.]